MGLGSGGRSSGGSSPESGGMPNGTSGGGPASSGGRNSTGSGGEPADNGGSPSDGGSAAAGGSGDSCQVDLECDPEPLPPTGDFAQDCVDRINQFRQGCFCLAPLERWSAAEVCAEANAEFDQDVDEPHAGWGADGVCSSEDGDLAQQFNGRATNECPSYPSEQSVVQGCLRQMYLEGAEWAEELGRVPRASDYENCGFEDCYSKYGHFIAMTNTAYSMVACGISEEAPYWSVQNFR